MLITRAALIALVVLSCGKAFGKDLFLPDPNLTPGFARTDLTVEAVCTTKWGQDVRHVTAAMKRQVFHEYGLTGNDDPMCGPPEAKRRCEVDHLISRELGGADDVRNLWPEPYGSHPWNATQKDRVENRLHKEVCAGAISLEQAQREISADWRVPYVRYFGMPAGVEALARRWRSRSR